MFLESTSIMKARQEVYCCFETRRTLRAAKDEDTYLPSCLSSSLSVPETPMTGWIHREIFKI